MSDRDKALETALTPVGADHPIRGTGGYTEVVAETKLETVSSCAARAKDLVGNVRTVVTDSSEVAEAVAEAEAAIGWMENVVEQVVMRRTKGQGLSHPEDASDSQETFRVTKPRGR